MQEGARAGQHKLFSRNLLQNSQALFIIIAPDILTVDNPGIEGLVGREAGLDQLQGFLAFDEVQTDSVYRQFDQIRVDIPNIAEVGLNQDFQSLLVSQEFPVEIKEEDPLFGGQVLDQAWLIQLDALSS